MKKIGKLNINTEKIIRNEELITLRGGYDDEGGDTTCIMCYNAPMANQNSTTRLGSLYSPCPSASMAMIYCQSQYPGSVSAAYHCGGNCYNLP